MSDGERIKLHDRIKIIIETDDVSQLSPASISRCGVIYFGNDLISLEEKIKNFVY